MLGASWKPRLAVPRLGWQGRRWAPTFCLLSCSLLRRGSVGLFAFHIAAEKSLTTLPVVETVVPLCMRSDCSQAALVWGSAQQSPWGLWTHADLWTQAYFHQENHLDQTQGILVPCSWHQYSLQALCLAVLPRFVLSFLLPPLGCWSSISCLPQVGAASTSEITMSGGFAVLGTGTKEEQGPAKSLMRGFYPSIDHPSATHGVWHNYLIWFSLLRWHPAEVTAARCRLPKVSLSQCPSAPQSHHCKGKPRATLLQKDERHLAEPFQHFWGLGLWNEPRGLSACFLHYHKSPQEQQHCKFWWGRVFVIRAEVGIKGMTHDDEGRMQEVWYFFLIKSEADTPLTQIKTGDILKKGPKPRSTLGLCTLLPWIGACWHCNNQQKCRRIRTTHSLQRIKPETTGPTSPRSVPNSSDIWGESSPPEASPETNYSSKGIHSSEWAANSMQQNPAKSCKPLTWCPEMHMWRWHVWSVRRQYTDSVTHGLDQALQLLHHS